MSALRREDRLQLLLRFGYDGADFYGVPNQPHGATVQSALTARLSAAVGQPPKALCFAARTDQGVHALANYATCWFPPGTVEDDALPALLAAIEAEGDDGLVGVEARRAGFHTHARALGVGKRYRYRLAGDRPDEALALSALPRPRPGRPAPRPAPPVWRTWQVAPPLELEPMRAAAALLVGRHDFRAFASGPFGDQPTTRCVHQLSIRPAEGPQGPHLVVEILGDGFLRNMVRVIVGSLAEVGAGLRPPDQLLAPLASGQRDDAGLTAPARALTLVDLLEVEPPEGGAPWAPRIDPAA